MEMLTGKGRTSGRAMLTYDLNYEVPRATDPEYRLKGVAVTTRRHIKINYTTWGGWVA